MTEKEIKSVLYQAITFGVDSALDMYYQLSANPWHTCTPTEEGEYLIKYRYPQNGMNHDVAEYPAPIWKMNIIEKWQKIEP